MRLKKSVALPANLKSKAPREKKIKAEAVFEFSRFQDEIQVQAYYNYLHRINDQTPGNEVSDWLDAEKRIKSKNGRK